MAEGIDLAPITREVLPPKGERISRLDTAIPQILAVVEGETDAVALEASLACLLWATISHANFCGFYRRVGLATLAVGPYQGSLGCLRIDFARGVCGAAATTQRTQRVPDVLRVANHITCDPNSRSELVVPVVCAGELRAVLDIDSPHLDAFSEEEARRLEHLLATIFDRPDVVW